MADRAAMSKNNQEGSLEDREGITEPSRYRAPRPSINLTSSSAS